ncbi:MAG: UDP-N-acetylglucosamine--N-acetylmuramyl-(pentapeptide) pyrophosphoryl-undecaprenol N-acetylglucosamine transferase [Candidatus Moraniibacteriota bacterium]|nr:MAG: UDP-N-acetylglucosamine--N-acetylmuramyl-(pentapeptide) pyrophosphoryl-undecaprenol N-acetylglucosamine transferase [Candidatus Moranbacteria bacterium]
MAKRVVLTGGLSGGHTFPLIAVARALSKELDGDVEFLFIGSRGRFEETAMAEAGIPCRFIVTAKWRRYASVLNFIDLFKLPIALIQALWHLLWFMPDVVFSKGGAASVPIAIAAALYRIPLLIHDSDAVAGRANRFAARFAARIAIAYERAQRYFPASKVALTGNPIREEVLNGDPERGRRSLGFSADRPAILIIGGSLGAAPLNRAVVRMIPDFLAAGYQVMHITGGSNLEQVQAEAVLLGLKPGLGYVALPFLPAAELADVYALATVVISRAGAGSIAELAALAKPVILVPLSTAANGEQRENAYEIARHGGAVVIEEANLGGHILSEVIADVIAHPEKARAMGDALRKHYYHPDAAAMIARGLMTLS